MKRFLLLSLAAGCIFANMSIASVFAETEQDNSSINAQQEDGISPHAEVTGYKYKMVNGIKFKRLWSYTYGRWIDPIWTIVL